MPAQKTSRLLMGRTARLYQPDKHGTAIAHNAPDKALENTDGCGTADAVVVDIGKRAEDCARAGNIVGRVRAINSV